MKDGGNDHCHVPAFVEVHCLEQAVVGHSIGVGAFQKQLDVFHLQEIKTRFKRNVKTLFFFSKTISLKKKFHDNVSVDTFFICQINDIILKKKCNHHETCKVLPTNGCNCETEYDSFVYQFIIIIIYNQIHVFSNHNIYNKTTSSNLNMYKSNKYSSEVDRVFLLRTKYNLKVYADFDTRIV